MKFLATRLTGQVDHVSTARTVWSLKLSCAGMLLSLVSSAVLASPPNQTLKQLYHTAWTFRDDAPISRDLIQTPDGFLWLGGPNGLYRYDGVRFDRFSPRKGPPLPTTAIFSLDLGVDGSLWIGWQLRGLSRLKNGVLTNYGEESGLPNATVNAVTQDGQGRVWAATLLGVYQKVDERWVRLGTEFGYHEGESAFTFADNQGVLWIAHDQAVQFLSPADGMFHTVLINTRIVSITAQPDGTIWGLTDKGVMVELPKGKGSPRSWKLPISAVEFKVLFDKAGKLWIATLDKGLFRITGFPQGTAAGQAFKAESLSQKGGGLSSDTVFQLFEDREGNMWTATSRGIDRLRKSAFNEFEIPQTRAGGKAAVLPSENGNLYILPADLPLIQFPQALVPAQKSRLPEKITCSYRSPSGVAWFAGRDFLWRRDKDAFTRFSLPISKMYVESMVSDGAEGLWVTFPVRNGFFHFHDGVWTTSDINPSLPTRSARSAMIDDDNRIWFGYSSSRIAVLEPSSQVKLFGKEEDQAIGAVSAMFHRGGHIWIGGDNGLRRFRNGRFEEIKTEDGKQLFGVTGIIETPAGDLWLNEALDIVKIPAAELKQATAADSITVKTQRFDVLDGLTGGGSDFDLSPLIAEGDNGKIWFALQNAVGWIDPENLPHNPVPPPVSIETVSARRQFLYRLPEPAVICGTLRTSESTTPLPA